MLPKNRMGREVFTQLKVHAGSEHPHAAQNPVDVTAEVKERCYPLPCASKRGDHACVRS